jgi:hypothetical protein
MMGRFAYAIIAGTFASMVMAPLPTVAYNQADVDACTPDAFRLCSSEMPDASRVALCLEKNKRQLSSVCSIVFSRARGANVDREPARTIRNTNF